MICSSFLSNIGTPYWGCICLGSTTSVSHDCVGPTHPWYCKLRKFRVSVKMMVDTGANDNKRSMGEVLPGKEDDGGYASGGHRRVVVLLQQRRVFDIEGTWRVGGILAMSRAFGNRMLKQFVAAEPEIQEQEVNEEVEVLVLGSDGLWDVVPNEDAVSIARVEEEAEAAARKLTETAFTRGSADNITCIVVKFHHHKAESVDPLPEPHIEAVIQQGPSQETKEENRLSKEHDQTKEDHLSQESDLIRDQTEKDAELQSDMEAHSLACLPN